MKFFLDCEFIEDGLTINLVSIGIVCSDSREYYAINAETDWSKADDWVKDKVLSKLPSNKPYYIRDTSGKRMIKVEQEHIKNNWRTKSQIAKEIEEFIFGSDERPTIDGYLDNKIEIWGEYCSSDWVVFYQLWGKMVNLPKGFPYRPNDIIQFMEQSKLTEDILPRRPIDQHHALADAKWIKQAWEIIDYYGSKKKGGRLAQSLLKDGSH